MPQNNFEVFKKNFLSKSQNGTAQEVRALLESYESYINHIVMANALNNSMSNNDKEAFYAIFERSVRQDKNTDRIFNEILSGSYIHKFINYFSSDLNDDLDKRIISLATYCETKKSRTVDVERIFNLIKSNGENIGYEFDIDQRDRRSTTQEGDNEDEYRDESQNTPSTKDEIIKHTVIPTVITSIISNYSLEDDDALRLSISEEVRRQQQGNYSGNNLTNSVKEAKIETLKVQSNQL